MRWLITWRRVGKSFHDHDIRKTAATRADSLERAQQLLGHQLARTTAQVYRVGPVKLDV